MKTVMKAARYARLAHAGVTRAHGTPYFTHPKAVARILWKGGCRDTAMLAAAYLHDTVEDTDTTLEKLTAMFGPEVSGLVDALTKRKGESFEDALARMLATGGDRALRMKLADREHNNSELHHLPADHKIREKAKAKTAALMDAARAFHGAA